MFLALKEAANKGLFFLVGPLMSLLLVPFPINFSVNFDFFQMVKDDLKIIWQKMEYTMYICMYFVSMFQMIWKFVSLIFSPFFLVFPQNLSAL